MLTCASSSDGNVNGSPANIYFVQPEFARNTTVHDRNIRFVRALLSKDEYSNIIFNDDRIIGRLRDRNDRRPLRRKSKHDDDSDFGDFPYGGNGEESLQRCSNVLLTTDGYELCPCANHDVSEEKLPVVPATPRNGRKSLSDLENQLMTSVDEIRTEKISLRTNCLSETKSLETVKGGIASSCATDEVVTGNEESIGRAGNDDGRKKRRCSELVDQLLVNIYGGGSSGGSGRDSTSTTRYGCSDFRDTGGDYSTDSSCSLILPPRYYASAKRRSLDNDSDQQQDKYKKWQSALRTRLMSKRVSELKNMTDVLQSQVSHAGSLLIRELKRKDFLNGRQEMQCSIVSAILQAKSEKRSTSTMDINPAHVKF